MSHIKKTGCSQKLTTRNLLGGGKLETHSQANLRYIGGSIPDHHHRASCNCFVGGRRGCLQFVENATSVKCDKANFDETRCGLYYYFKYNAVRFSPSDA